ncbi:MAG TPA: flagellar basal body P-ring formation chaperone FlgA [Bryobacteraceae bacterium]|nr:flagellar basal body P-ring formation chaperone FlgA [Bryobacteraceae bacterium]
MIRTPLHLALILGALWVATQVAKPCVAVDSERITAGDLARGLPAFSSVPASEEIGYSPIPGVRRYFYFPELHRLALQYNVDVPAGAQACIERLMETLHAEPVIEAMRKALDDPAAHIEILELSKFPVPHGDLEFDRSTLPVGTDAPVVWRGIVRYAGGRKFGVWASVKLRVQGVRVVATDNLAAGKTIHAGQVKLEPAEVYPMPRAAALTLEGVIGNSVRIPVAAGGVLYPGMVDAPKEVERGDTVQVEVQSGAALLKLEATAESAGRHGEPIRVHTLVSGRSFSARVTGKDRVVVATGIEPASQDPKP